MKLYFVALLFAFTAIQILPRSPLSKDQRLQAANQETSKNQEASENLESTTAEDIISSLEAERKKLEAQYQAQIIKLEDSTIQQLIEMAREQAAGGKIADAKETWIELLKLDPNNADGKEFCEALGIWPQVRKQLGKLRTSKTKTYDRIEYQCASGRVFKKQSNGLWSDTNFPVMYREMGRNEYAVTIVAVTSDADVHVLLPDHYLFAKGRDWKKGQRYRGEDGGWVR